MALRFLLILLFLPWQAFAQEFFPVYWKKDLPPLNDIFFFNTSLGLVVGNQGTILKSIDEGYNWEPLNAPTTEDLQAVCLVTSETAFIAGNNGIILKTTNGGQNWQLQNSPSDQRLLDIDFWNEQLGFAIGLDGTLLRTANGGEQWDLIDLTTSTRLNALSVVSENVQYIASDEGIWKSSDSGLSWTNDQYDFTEDINTTSNRIDDINFISEETGYILNYGYNGSLQQVFKTTNAGQNWESVLGSGSFLTGISFENENAGFATGMASDANINKFINGNLQQSWYLPHWWDWMYRPNFSYKIHSRDNNLNSLSGYVLEGIPDQNNIDNFTFFDHKITKSTDDIQDRNVLMGIFEDSDHFAELSSKNFYNQAQLIKLNADSTVNILKTLESDSEGLFSFNTFENDSIYLRIFPYDRDQHAPYYFPDHLTINEAEPFVFNTGKFKAVRYGKMPKETTSGAGIIRGKIFEPSGEGKKDLPLILISQNNNMAAMTTTDQTGDYEFSNLKNGQYKVVVDLPFIHNEALNQVELEQSNETKTVNFTLQKNLLVAGKKTLPAAPENLQAVQIDQNYIELSWQDKSDNEQTFIVEKSIDEGAFEAVVELAENTEIFLDEAIEEGLKYEYRVHAKNEYGSSSFSNTVSLTSVITNVESALNLKFPVVYPVPFLNNQIFIKNYDKSSPQKINLFDSKGKELNISNLLYQDDQIVITTEHIPAGIYLLKIYSKNISYSYKLIKR
ncbi:hypothetical protein BH23BAC1_BH23BAC1_18000 [soil metagenome]